MLVIALYLPFVCLIAPSLGSVLKRGIKLVVGCLMMEKKWLVKIALKNKKGWICRYQDVFPIYHRDSGILIWYHQNP